MTNENYIDKIIYSFKKKLDKNNNIYRTSYKGNIILSKTKFNKPLKLEQLKNITDINLPQSYIDFLKISNGAEFFIDDYKGSKCILELFSLNKIIKEKQFCINSLNEKNEYPIGVLLDNCELMINEIDLKNKKNYLFLSNGSKKFNYNFQEWLDKFIIAQGNEFWLLDYPY